MSDIQRKCVANPVADSYHESDADIKNDVAVPDMQLDSTNEQESDGSELILEKKVDKNLLDLRPVEILEKVLLDAMKLSDYSFPGDVCWTFNHAIAAIPQLERFKERALEFVPRIYFSNITNLPKPRLNNQTHGNLQRIISAFGSMSGICSQTEKIYTESYELFMDRVSRIIVWLVRDNGCLLEKQETLK